MFSEKPKIVTLSTLIDLCEKVKSGSKEEDSKKPIDPDDNKSVGENTKEEENTDTSGEDIPWI